jgi:Icc-related predicted phosphoesterase
MSYAPAHIPFHLCYQPRLFDLKLRPHIRPWHSTLAFRAGRANPWRYAMRVLVINAIDGRLDRLQAVLDRQPRDIAAVFVLGNLTPAGARREAYQAQVRSGQIPAPVIEALDRESRLTGQSYANVFTLLGNLGVPVYLIPGEHDAPFTALAGALQAHWGTGRLILAHRAVHALPGGDAVAGFGGLLTPAPDDARLLLHFPDWMAQNAFENLAAFSSVFREARRRIFLFAMPPRAGHLDLHRGTHTGDSTLNTIIKTYKPNLVCCGGSDGTRGVEVIEGALVVRPGSLVEGAYAVVDLDRMQAQLEWLDTVPAIDTGMMPAVHSGSYEAGAGM